MNQRIIMSRKMFAIANCRVSSDEQLLNNSIARQTASVHAAADKLGVEIVKVWSGSVSSKAGTNIRRKDLLEMLDAAKRDKRIKYAIFDEYDRYMRSVNEGPYFEVLFQQLGVKVWYASESDSFNGDDAMAKFMRTMSAFKAAGSNEERQRKSIAGQTTALKAGRYPFHPKPGYMRGAQTSVPEIHPVRGKALKSALTKIASGELTPSEGLKLLNSSEYTNERKPLKMDKFRKIATDGFYAGILEISKQINVRQEQGIHERLITLEQHHRLVDIFDSKKKNQSGPRKNGNPEYPLSNIVTCSICVTNSTIPRYVGYKHSNGKNKELIYHKYRCRACKRYLSRDELHAKVELHLKQNHLSTEAIKLLVESLETVRQKRDEQSQHDVTHLERKISNRQ